MSANYRTKECRAFARAIEKAGGEVRLTRRGHLRVRGPKGVTIVSSELRAPREQSNAIADLARYSGIRIEP